MTIRSDSGEGDERTPGVEGQYLNYGPFRTRGIGGASTDGSRAAAVSVLGIALLLCGAFLAAHHAIQWGRASGRFDAGLDVPVRFAMAAFGWGLFAVPWGLFFLPLLGTRPGFLWGGEYPGPHNLSRFLEATRYANVGFLLGILGAVACPAHLGRRGARGPSTPRPTGSPPACPPRR